MSLNTIVLVNQISNLSDARYCAGMGVEMLGFSLQEEQVTYTAPTTFKEIAGWVAGVKLVGEVQDIDAEQVLSLLQDYPLDMLQLNSIYLVEELEKFPLPILLRILIDKDTNEEALVQLMDIYQPHVEYFVVDSEEISTIDGTNEKLLKNLADRYPVLLGFGLTKENTRDALDSIQPAGIALKGGQEIRPGFKDFDELEEIFEQLED